MLRLPNALFSFIQYLDVRLYMGEIVKLKEVVAVHLISNTIFGIVITKNNNDALYLHLVDMNSLLIVGGALLLSNTYNVLEYSPKIRNITLPSLFSFNINFLYSEDINSSVIRTVDWEDMGFKSFPNVFQFHNLLESLYLNRNWDVELGTKYRDYINELIDKYLLREWLEMKNRNKSKYLYEYLDLSSSTYEVVINNIRQLEDAYPKEFTRGINK